MSLRFAKCLTSPEGPQYHAISRRNGNFLNLCAVAIVFATMFTPANANFDQGICFCDTDHAYVYLSPGPYASVNVTMGWCQQNCGGYKLSSSDEWLRPLATWILPTVALLLLCSVGEDKDDDEASWWKKIRDLIGFGYKAREYVALIGDPASAICGGFSEIFTDARVLLLKPRNWSEKAMRGLWTKVNAENNQQNTTLLETSTATDGPSRTHGDKDISVIQGSPVDSEVQTRLFYGIRVILTARLDFINAIFLPVVLLFATTIASFHDAYDNNGDIETAHNLAYGVWYSWVIILAVVSNSYAASVNPGVAEAAIRDLVDPRSHPTVPGRWLMAS
ncbi:uncharacterized protein PAC_19028 [Phialocephala subalpina]|uniref:Uncharacterized protein n=1 Tax=Phialocephala subalpina TaxID=576137 RepID=A0A1L7XVU0_9HELO|nr:uncharacterized protein PAC_19028 [Phialocephala subalpina]